MLESDVTQSQIYIINRASYGLLDWWERGEAKKIIIFVAFAAPSSCQILQFYLTGFNIYAVFDH
jgi:hypothetical protein